ncbi:MAG: hypothetical protein ABEI52_01015 [Halobacteriaceae archaeon]
MSAAPRPTDGEVMASLDKERLVIADISRDDAWVSAEAELGDLEDWR